MVLNVDKVYITHWSKLTDRKNWLINHLSESNIDNYTWVENYDKDNWNIEDIKIEYPSVFGLNPKGRNLKYSEISLVLKHCWIVKDAFENKYESILILEDDVVLEDNFISNFNNYKDQLPLDWDICWVGSCCNLHSRIIPGVNVYRENSSRCTHAYMLSKSCINKIIESIKFVNDGADWYYNNLIESFNLNNYWFEPSLASQNNMYETTIQNNNYN
jgi:GR25 family glycosyltransferase involved in LPS biosynthesis